MARRKTNSIGSTVNQLAIISLLLVTAAGVAQSYPTFTLVAVLLAGAFMTAAALTPWVAALRK